MVETFREKLGWRLLGPRYNPERPIFEQAFQLVREEKEKEEKLSPEQLDLLTDEEKQLPLEEQKKILAMFEEERLEPRVPQFR